MKAWTVTSRFHDDDRTRLEFADTANKARSASIGSEEFHDVAYHDLRAHRAKQFDGRESNTPTWQELVEKHGWHMECLCGRCVRADDNPQWENDQPVRCDECAKKCENCGIVIPEYTWACMECMGFFDGDRFTGKPERAEAI